MFLFPDQALILDKPTTTNMLIKLVELVNCWTYPNNRMVLGDNTQKSLVIHILFGKDRV